MWIFAIVMAAREINHKLWLKDKEHWVLLFPCILVSTDCLYFKSKKKKKKKNDIHIACLGKSIGALPGISDDSLVMGSRDYLSSPSVSDCPFLLSCCWALATVVLLSGCFHFMLDTIPLPSLFHCIIPWQSHLVILYWCVPQCREPRKKPNNHLPLFLETVPLFADTWSFSCTMSLWMPLNYHHICWTYFCFPTISFLVV